MKTSSLLLVTKNSYRQILSVSLITILLIVQTQASAFLMTQNGTASTSGITATGIDSTNIASAQGITATGIDGITATGIDGTVYRADSLLINQANGITATGIDELHANGVNGASLLSPDSFEIAH